MSASLSVEIDPGPIERTRADVVVVFFFDSDRPLQGGAGRADWRLCGRLSQLILSGKLAGAAGEAVLVPTGGGLRAPLLIGLGLGSRHGFDAERCAALARDGTTRALRLGARTAALPLPDASVGDLALEERIEAVVAGAAGAVDDLSTELRLRLVPSPAESVRAQRALADAQPKRLPPSVALWLRGAAPPGTGDSPRGVHGHPPQRFK